MCKVFDCTILTFKNHVYTLWHAYYLLESVHILHIYYILMKLGRSHHYFHFTLKILSVKKAKSASLFHYYFALLFCLILLVFFGECPTMCLDCIQLSPLTSSDPFPLPYPLNFVSSFKLIELNLFCSYTVGCVVTHWSILYLAGAAPLKRTGSPFPVTIKYEEGLS